MKFPHAHALAGLAASAALGAPSVALAHDIWVVPVPQDGKIVAHVRYADPGRLELAERGKVISLEVISPSGKTLLHPGSYTVSSHALVEITPLSEPHAVPVGGDLAVKVERRGQPLAGVKLTYGDGLEPNPEDKMPSVTTGKDGVARIPVSRKGPYLITTHQEGPPSFPSMADKDDVYASLAFDTAN